MLHLSGTWYLFDDNKQVTLLIKNIPIDYKNDTRFIWGYFILLKNLIPESARYSVFFKSSHYLISLPVVS